MTSTSSPSRTLPSPKARTPQARWAWATWPWAKQQTSPAHHPASRCRWTVLAGWSQGLRQWRCPGQCRRLPLAWLRASPWWPQRGWCSAWALRLGAQWLRPARELPLSPPRPRRPWREGSTWERHLCGSTPHHHHYRHYHHYLRLPPQRSHHRSRPGALRRGVAPHPH